MQHNPITNYQPLDGFNLPENGFYELPEIYQALPVKKRKYNITNWEWLRDRHGETVTTIMQQDDVLCGVLDGHALGICIAKGGNNWPQNRHVSLANIEIKRVHYYAVIFNYNVQGERLARLVIDDFDDVAVYCGEVAV